MLDDSAPVRDARPSLRASGSGRSAHPLRRAQGRGGGGWVGRTLESNGQRRYVHNNPRTMLTRASVLIRDCVTSARARQQEPAVRLLPAANGPLRA